MGEPKHGKDPGSGPRAVIMAALLKAVDDEPEYPGEMPDEMFDVIRQSKDIMEEALRIAVRDTKEGIRRRIVEAAENGTRQQTHEKARSM